jgi:hypothetical protein
MFNCWTSIYEWTVNSSVSYSLCSEPERYNVIYYVIAVRARSMVRIFILPYLSNRSKSDPCSYELFCLESHILSFPKVLQIPPKSPCMCLKNNLILVIPKCLTYIWGDQVLSNTTSFYYFNIYFRATCFDFHLVIIRPFYKIQILFD